jgi:hypothetical protein
VKGVIEVKLVYGVNGDMGAFPFLHSILRRIGEETGANLGLRGVVDLLTEEIFIEINGAMIPFEFNEGNMRSELMKAILGKTREREEKSKAWSSRRGPSFDSSSLVY